MSLVPARFLGVKEVLFETKMEVTELIKDRIADLFPSYESFFQQVVTEIPAGAEVVLWMQRAEASQRVGQKLNEVFKKRFGGSPQLTWLSGDAYIPGVYNSEYSAYRVPGNASTATVTAGGVTVMTVPINEKRQHNLVAQALYRYRGAVQNVLDIIRQSVYTRLPLSQTYNLPAVGAERGYLAPMGIFTYRLLRPALSTQVIWTITTETPAEVALRFYTSGKAEIGRSEVNAPQGTSRFLTIARGLPFTGYMAVDPLTSGSRGINIESIKTIPLSV